MTPEREKLLRKLFGHVILSAMEESVGPTHLPVGKTWREITEQFTQHEIWTSLKDLFPELDE